MRVLPLLLLALLVACCPTREVIREPGPVEYRERLVVDPIPAELLQPHPIASGTVSQCIDVAAARRAEIEACNADKAALRERGGK